MGYINGKKIALTPRLTVVNNNYDGIDERVVDAKIATAIESTKEDMVYIQNPNLYDGKAVRGGRVHTTGKPNDSAVNHARNENRIVLDISKSYNIQTQMGISGSLYIYIFLYNSEGKIIPQSGGVNYIQARCTDVVHISGAKEIDFFIAGYTQYYGIDTDGDGKGDDVKSMPIMVWEDDETRPYAEYLDYGETSKYYRTELALNDENLASAMLKRDKAKFDNSFNYIAYSGQVSGWYANTVEHFEWCAQQSIFTAIKGDIQLTSDNKIIMCHDAGFTFNTGGRIVTYNSANSTKIHDLTEEQCLALEFNSPTNGVYSHPANIDTYLFICKKYGMIPFITIRDNYIDETVNVLLKKLDKFNLRDRAIINSFTYETLQNIREKDASITLSRVQQANKVLTKDSIDKAVSLGNCMVSGFDFGAGQGGIGNLTEDVLAYAREKDIRVYEGLCDISDVDDLIKLGVAGAQISSLNESEEETA